MKTLRNILLPVGIGLTLIVLIGLFGSGLTLYREARDVHPILGVAVLVLLAVGVGLFLVYPVVRLLALPGALVRPGEPEGARWISYLRRYTKRLLRNRHIVAGYTRRDELKRVHDEKDRDPILLEKEVGEAIRFLDDRAREVICRHAAGVFVATAVSQSGRLDTAIVLSAQFRLIKEVAQVYYQRPSPRELVRLYVNVGSSAFIAGEIQDSEVLAVLGAPVSAGLSGLVPIGGTDPLVSLLVSSLLDGSANALLTLRIGILARRHCGIRLEENRTQLARSASLEAAGLLGGVVAQGAHRVASATRRLVVGGAVRGTGHAAKGVVSAGATVLGGLARWVGRAGATATAVTRSATRQVTSRPGRDESTSAPAAESGAGEPSEQPVSPEDLISPEAREAALPEDEAASIARVLRDSLRFWEDVEARFGREAAAGEHPESAPAAGAPSSSDRN